MQKANKQTVSLAEHQKVVQEVQELKQRLTGMAYMLILTAGLAAFRVQAQPPDGWRLFEKVTFENRYFEEYAMMVSWPRFDNEIRAFEGKEVMLSGYIIPTADAPGYEGLILSKYTYAQCFFCGKAGLGTVAEVRLSKKLPDFKIDKPYVFKGKLLLNENDADHLCFIITDATLMEL